MPALNRPSRLRLGFAVLLLPSIVLSVAFAACTDDPPPPSGPGNTIVNDTNEDARITLTQETGTVVPQGVVGDGGYALDALPDGAYGGSTGYADVVSPMAACASCVCSQDLGFCLENGTTAKVTGVGIEAGCPFAAKGKLAVGCNPLPDACYAHPTCQCLLDAVQPPLGCYPECTNTGGIFDIFCSHP